MAEFRTIAGQRGLVAYQLGRFGEVTGGWRVERHGIWITDCDSEIGVRIMLHALAHVTDEEWLAARRRALADMVPVRREAA